MERSSGISAETKLRAYRPMPRPRLSGDWKAMISHSKAEIRQSFRNRYSKVVHKGEWLRRVRDALRGFG